MIAPVSGLHGIGSRHMNSELSQPAHSRILGMLAPAPDVIWLKPSDPIQGQQRGARGRLCVSYWYPWLTWVTGYHITEPQTA